jgi:hypothetical protein
MPPARLFLGCVFVFVFVQMTIITKNTHNTNTDSEADDFAATRWLVGIVSLLYFSADGDAAANDGLYLIFLALVVFGASLRSRFIPRPFEHSNHSLDALAHIKVPGFMRPAASTACHSRRRIEHISVF